MTSVPAYQTEIAAREGQSGSLVALFKDENGDPVELGAISGLTLELYDVRRYKAYLVARAAWVAAGSVAEDEPDDDSTINGWDEITVLNAAGGTFYDELQTVTIDGETFTYNFRFEYTPDDTPFFGEDDAAHQVESHIAHFHARWDGGTKGIGHEVLMKVTNFRRYEVEEPT